MTHIYLGWDFLAWGSRPGWLGAVNDWWLQLFVLLALLFVYVTGVRRAPMPASLVAAGCVVLLGLQLLTLFPCISY